VRAVCVAMPVPGLAAGRLRTVGAPPAPPPDGVNSEISGHIPN
jgi:CP family cyanate transporter-like MFS transporter